MSKALWLPTLWMMFTGTRTVSQWLGAAGLIGGVHSDAGQYIEGNPIDRVVFVVLIFLGLFVLLRREINLSKLFKNNFWLWLLIIYGGISIFWSDFPFVSFKRWIKSFGNIIMVLVVLTEDDPAIAIKILIRRFVFVFVPLSIVLIKYFPGIGRGYGVFDGRPFFTGATTGKNALGALCVVSGYYLIWDMSVTWLKSKNPSKKIIIDFTLLAMTVWVLIKASSATSYLCLSIGITILIMTKLQIVQSLLKRGVALGVIGIFLALFFYYFFGQASLIATTVDMTGHSDTFWGRTVLWGKVIEMNPNPLLGAGFESFWLGERLITLWDTYWWHPNQAHNGYLEIYINLGAIGLILILFYIILAYKNILKSILIFPDYGRFRLGFLFIALAYNITEAAFKGLHFMWFMFLISTLEISKKGQS